MDLGLRNKVIMVAAASRGLGLAIARAVAFEGAHVSIASPTESRIQGAARKFREQTGSEVIPNVFDACDGDSIVNWYQDTCSRFGEPDEFGRAGAFLLSEAASYITGETLIVDGGAM